MSSIGLLFGARCNTGPATVPLEQLPIGDSLHNVGGQLNLTPFVALLVTIGVVSVSQSRRTKIWLWITAGVTLATAIGFTATAAMGEGATALLGRGMLGGYIAWQILALAATDGMSEGSHSTAAAGVEA